MTSPTYDPTSGPADPDVEQTDLPSVSELTRAAVQCLPPPR